MVEQELGIKEFLSSNKYALAPRVLFVPGVSRGAIYDLNTGQVFSLNPSACEILQGKQEDTKFWSSLEQLGLATKDKIKSQSIIPELLRKPELEFVWFEVTSDDCNERCIHCYAETMPPSDRKELDLPQNNLGQKEKLNFGHWKNLIEDAFSLGCRRCQFIGGEPFLYRGGGGETVLDLAEHAKRAGFEFIEIFTNATIITKERVKKIKELGLNIAVSLYSNDEKTHESITKTPGSFRKTIEALKLLKEEGIPTRVETVLMRPNEATIKDTQKFVEEMGFAHKAPDVLRPRGRGDNPSLVPSKETVAKYGLVTRPDFKTNKELLARYISGNSCLFGKIAITDKGEVLPCIFSRNFSVGNVLKTSLKDVVLGKKLGFAWNNTKDDVLVCQDCEYRYACLDCRPLSEGVNQGRGQYLSAPYPRCTYNPYTGKWAKGVWRLDKNGTPFYDRTISSSIGKEERR